MFYVFDSTGRTFNGTLESLRRVEKTTGIRSERTVIDLDDAGDPPTFPMQPGNPADDQAAAKNARQYGDMLVQQGNKEVVYHAYQIMTRPAQCISSLWILSQAAEHFRAFPFQAFPIVDDRQQLIGLLSRRQFYEYLLSDDEQRNSLSSSVADCFVSAHSSIYCADPVTDVRRIATLLVEKRLDAVPIVEDSCRIVGIVSRTDILKCAVSDPPLSLWV
ncbi:MAG: acetoin utilization protein AcuB [Bacteroidia bacterium]|jgi:acetoin utilization protein AcuB